VIAMGDFNDEPFDRSLAEYALSERVERRVKSLRSRKPYFLNLMWRLMGSGVGTYYHDGTPAMLDQIMVNRPVLRDDSPFEVFQTTLEIFRLPEMQTTSGAPNRFGRPSSARTFDESGFSDHFPITVVVEETTVD